MADGDNLKFSFCLLLWRYNGGQVTPDLKQLSRAFDLSGEPLVKYVRGYCTRAYDCFTCETMQEEIASHPQGEAIWVCPSCVGPAVKAAKAAGVPYHLPGHYTEGQCQYKHCDRPPYMDNGVERPAGYSPYLQILFGPINNRP